jgi:hypothetical protein
LPWDAESAPPVAQVMPAVAWLADHDVPSERVRAAFGITPGHRRQLVSRGRKGRVWFPYPVATLPELLQRDINRLLGRTGVRRSVDERYLGTGKRSRNDELKQHLDRIVSAHRIDGSFLDAIPELSSLKRLVGHVGEIGHIRLKGELLRAIAWFCTHSGQSVSAFQYALEAADLYQITWHETGCPDDLNQLAGCSLIASNACLLGHDPDTALRILDVADKAAEAAGPGNRSDHFRQRGVALFQKCVADADNAALDAFRSCDSVLREHSGELSVSSRMNRLRTSLLAPNPDFESAEENLQAIRLSESASSLEKSMAIRWTCASGLVTDSETVHRRVADILSSAPPVEPGYGHQRTVRGLLAITAELGLPDGVRLNWIRWVLYENAYKSA